MSRLLSSIMRKRKPKAVLSPADTDSSGSVKELAEQKSSTKMKKKKKRKRSNIEKKLKDKLVRRAQDSAKKNWQWFQSLTEDGSQQYILGPMVGQSELAFRMLCREYGASLCYTPMFLSDKFVASPEYRRDLWQTCKEDRPLVVQFCGNKADVLLQAAMLVQDQCDAIDLNLGCPQKVAERYADIFMGGMLSVIYVRV